MLKKPIPRKSDQLTIAPQLAEVFADRTRSLADPIGLDNVPLYNDHPGQPEYTYHYTCRAYIDRLVVYKDYCQARSRSTSQIENEANLSRGKYNGWISRNSRSKIRKSLEGWIKSIEVNRNTTRSRYKPKHAYVTFATLTLPSDQKHGDNEIKRKVLMPFIQRLDRELGVQEWFWKAEPQKNGNIHFHLLLDRYIDKDLLQNYWNLSTETLGYLTAYFEKSGSLFPPSTNIKKCPDDLSMVGYVMKYVSKSPIKVPSFRMEGGQRIKQDKYYERKLGEGGQIEYKEWRKIEGRVWGMSKGIRDCRVFSSEVSYRLGDFARTLRWDPEVGIKEEEHFTIFYCNVQSKMFEYDRVLLSDYCRFYRNQYRALYVKSARDQVPEVPIVKIEPPPPEPPKQPQQLRIAI